MSLSCRKLIPYLLLFIQIVSQLRICLYSDSTNTQFINLQHQLKQQQKQSCIACLPTCKSCTSVNDQTCANGNCQSGYYFNTIVSKCQRCKNMCEECTTYQVCAKCINGYYFDYQNNCKQCPRGVSTCTSSSILECMNGFYYDSQAFLCRKCSDLNCIDCSAKLQCNRCQSGFLLNGNATGCLPCGIINCQKCSIVGTCQSCLVGYQLISNNFCQMYVCSSINKCKQCKISNSITLCTLCEPGFFLIQNSCQYGSSMMCEYSLTPQIINKQGFSYVGNGDIFNLLTDYGSCATCNQKISRVASNTQTFCIPKISQMENVVYSQFFVFNQHLICTIPYMHTSIPASYFIFNHDMAASYQLNLQIFVIVLGSNVAVSSLLGKRILNVNININNSVVNQQIQPYQLICSSYIPSNSIIAKYSSTFKILTDYDGNATNQIEKLVLNLSINTQLLGNSSLLRISIKQLYMKLSLCTVKDCIQCLSASSCTKCSYPYFVQNFLCVISCDVGYYLNNVTRKCLSQCQSGYFPNLSLDYVCIFCPSQCLTCKSIQFCYTCSQGYYLTLEGKCSKNCSIQSKLTEYYPNQQSGECKKCENPCKTCSLTAKNCTTCMIGFQIYNNSIGYCVFECPIGYFSKVFIQVSGLANPTCMACFGTCKACEMNMSLCTICYNGFYLYQNQCLSLCPDKYFAIMREGWGGICKQCIAPCNTCYGVENNCTTCRYNLYLFKNTQLFGQCVSICPPQLYFTNVSSYICQKCTNQNCLQCSQSIAGSIKKQICTKCQNNYKLENNQCGTTCQNAWPILDVCQKCPYPCGLCTGINQLNYTCSKCLDLYFLSSNGLCVLKCNIGEYGDWSSSTCKKCPIQCNQCILPINSSTVVCKSCNTNYIFYNTTCIAQSISCPISTYIKTTNDSSACLTCNPECLQCQLAQNRCKRCKVGKYLLSFSNECLDDCPYGYLNDYYNAFCVRCTGNCADCTQMPYNCTSCPDNYYKYYNSTIKYNSCVTNDECQGVVGYYSNRFNGQCSKCPVPCIDCISQSICIQCDNNSYLFKNSCISECLKGYYGNNRECQPCAQQCQTCRQQNKCISCKIKYFFQPMTSQCLAACYLGQFANIISMTCQPCNYPCETCINMEYCLTCSQINQSKLVLFKGQCLLKCPDGFYLFQNLTISCVACNISCSICNSVNQCSSCNFGYYLYFKKCLQSQQCPQKFYPDFNSRICAACQLPCVTCISKFQCTTCIDGHYLRQYSCYLSCPIGTYRNDNGSCISCQKNCLRCYQNQCNQCKEGIYLYKNQTDQKIICVESCPLGTYYLISQSTCELCSQACQTCQKKSNNCTSCISSKMLENSRCVTNCSNFYYQMSVDIVHPQFIFKNSTVCQRCNNSCYSCSSFQVCHICDSSYLVFIEDQVQLKGTFYNKSYCSQSCPISTFKDSQIFRCLACQAGCLKCQSSSSCQQCSYELGYVLYNINCIVGPCPVNLFTIQGQNKCVQEQFCLINSDSYYIFRKQRKCMKNCYKNLLMNNNKECVSQCNEGQLINFERVCVPNNNKLPIYSFTLYPVVKKGVISMVISTGTKVNPNWISLFDSFEVISGIDWKFNGPRRLQQSYGFKLAYPNSQPYQNALILQIIPETPILQPMDLIIFVRMSNAYSKQINIEGFPLQNWQYSTTVLSYMVRQQDISYYYEQKQSIRSLSIFFIVIAILISCVNYIKSGKVYLLCPVWDFMSLLYLFNYLNVHWPLQMGLILNQFAVSWLKIFSIPFQSIVISPEKVHANSTDMHLLRNIVCNLVIIGIMGLGYLVIMGISKISQWKNQEQDKKLKQTLPNKISKHFSKLLFICAYLSVPNLLYFSLINMFYSNKTINILSQAGFLYIQIPIIILLAVICIYIFQKQIKESMYLDCGINPEKRKIIICLPVYIMARKLLIIIFLAAFYNNAVYPLCFGLISTAFIFIMICWFQPYNNKIRYRFTLAYQALLFVFFLFCFIYACNQKQIMSTNFYKFLIFQAIVIIVLALIYPSYHLYRLLNLRTLLLKIKNSLFRSNQQVENNDEYQGICIEQVAKNKKILRNNQIEQENIQDSAQCINQKEKKQITLIKSTKKKLKLPKDTLIEGQTDHQADYSSEEGERKKVKLADYTVRLVKRGGPLVKQLKNYDISEKQQPNEEQNLAQKQIHLSKLIEKQNNLIRSRKEQLVDK